jgi:hypothetical protein
MTSDDFTMTDTQLKRALGSLADGPSGDLLAADVLRVVDVTAQDHGWAGRLPRMTGRMAAVAVTILLLLAIGGSAVLLSGILPPPIDGTPGVLNILPGRGEMRFVIPEGSELAVHRDRPTEHWYQLNRSNSSAGPTIDILPALALVHPCPAVDGGASRIPLRSTPQGFLVDLREIAGVGVVGEAATTLDGYPAWSATIDPNHDCGPGDIHFPGAGGIAPEGPSFNERPGSITVVDVNGSPWVILVSASEGNLDAFQPVADAFLSSIDFVESGGLD